MHHQLRSSLVLIFLVAGLLAPGALASPQYASQSHATPIAQQETKLYIGHASRLTLEIPADWMPTIMGSYSGPDGAVRDAPVPGAGLTLDAACKREAAQSFYGTAPKIESTNVAGRPACLIRPSSDQPAWAMGTMSVIVSHPHPFESFGEPVDFVAIGIDPAHFKSIIATVNFDPNAVTPADYLSSVIDLIETMSIKRDALNWNVVRNTAMATVGATGSLSDAYPGIQYVLEELVKVGDYHSIFLTPEDLARFAQDEGQGFGFGLEKDTIVLVFPGSPADRAGVEVGDVIQSIDGERLPQALSKLGNQAPKARKFSLKRAGVATQFDVTIKPGTFDMYLSPAGRRMGGVGYVELFGVTGDNEIMSHYATTAQDLIEQIDQVPTCGWVIDLRRNFGGSYFPMVAGVGSILGNGYFWGNQTADGEKTLVEYRDGHILDNGVDYFGQLVEGPLYTLKEPMPPVAVLAGPSTYSSGEVTLLSFVGRPNTRLFGQHSGGLTTSNATLELFDGAGLFLAVSVMTDRNGTPYLNGVDPDVSVETDWNKFGTDDDPALQTALEWLHEQPACAAGQFGPNGLQPWP